MNNKTIAGIFLITSTTIIASPGTAYANPLFSASADIQAGIGEQYVSSSANFQYNYAGVPGASGSASGNGTQSGGASGTTTSANATGSTSTGDGNTSASTASADLSTGSTHVSNTNTMVTGNFGDQGVAIANLNDTLTFTAAGATASTVTTIGVTFTIDGTMATNFTGGTPAAIQQQTAVNGYLQSFLVFGSADTRGFVQLYQSTGYLAVASGDTYPGGGWSNGGTWVTTNGANGAETLTFNGDYSFTGASAIIPISLDTSMWCYYGITCDFGNTQTVALTLPSNVSFTSASGVFLSAANPAATVPEPVSITLLASGLIAFGATRRKISKHGRHQTFDGI